MSIGLATKEVEGGACDHDGWTGPLKMSFHFDGDACWASPEECRPHAWVSAGYRNIQGKGSGTGNCSDGNPFDADSYLNGWHNIKIEVDHALNVSAYVDGQRFYRGDQPIDATSLKNVRLYLGDRSSGSAGKGYHDFINLTFF